MHIYTAVITNHAAQTKVRKTASEIISTLTDAQLYQKCKEYGFNARVWLRKFAGLLPEVEKRKLYKKRGFASIHEFCAKLAGMSYGTTDKILWIANRLHDKPLLYELFISGAVGWSKIEIVSFVATKETDKTWADKVRNLTCAALTAYIKELKQKQEIFRLKSYAKSGLRTEGGSHIEPDPEQFNRLKTTDIGSGENKQFICQPSDILHQQNELGMKDQSQTRICVPVTWGRLSFPLSPELEFQLKLFKQNLEKQKKITLSWAEVMTELLRGKINETANEKQTIISFCPQCVKNEANEKAKNGEVTRYIPASIKKFILARFKNHCAYSSCTRPPDILHHTRRFSLEKNHDPDFIIPLCKIHERLVHGIDVKVNRHRNEFI